MLQIPVSITYTFFVRVGFSPRFYGSQLFFSGFLNIAVIAANWILPILQVLLSLPVNLCLVHKIKAGPLLTVQPGVGLFKLTLTAQVILRLGSGFVFGQLVHAWRDCRHLVD